MNNRLLLISLSVLFLLSGSPTGAREATPLAKDPAVEARMMNLAHELRCLVCQNQTIADSHADLANDLKEEIREMIKAGKTDDEIKSFMTERYGDFVLYRPPLKFKTLLLWIGPAVLLLITAVLFILNIRSRQHKQASAFLSEEQHRQAQSILQEKE